MQRVFIAVDISDDARAAAARYMEELRSDFAEARVGWERPEKLHLTVKFLGNIDDALLAELNHSTARAAASTAPFGLELAGTGVFPKEGNAKVLWLGLTNPIAELMELAEKVETVCEELGLPRENRAFRPHLTIGRVKDPISAARLAASHLAREFGPYRFIVSYLVIYKSELQRTGSVYSKLTAFNLKS